MTPVAEISCGECPEKPRGEQGARRVTGNAREILELCWKPQRVAAVAVLQLQRLQGITQPSHVDVDGERDADYQSDTASSGSTVVSLFC